MSLPKTVYLREQQIGYGNDIIVVHKHPVPSSEEYVRLADAEEVLEAYRQSMQEQIMEDLGGTGITPHGVSH